MSVAELIAELQKLPKDLPVMVKLGDYTPAEDADRVQYQGSHVVIERH